MNEEQYLKRKEVAKILKVHPMTVFREIQRGRLKAIKVGNDYRISPENFEEYVKYKKENGK